MRKKDPQKQTRTNGRIFTFYSYKGGTGRSMAVANVAWILASQGGSVLVIDWDLEAPGLHRYFHPFIEDKELSTSLGLIDFLLDFVEGSRKSHLAKVDEGADPWFEKYASLMPYAFSLDWDFAKGGTIDFVPAGQQGPGYGVRVMTFDWQSFYEKLGGGVFLESVKKRLREDYDYVLIDSRTGISDTSGICTVQMPDDLVVCFTFNNQSILGCSAVAESAFSQRRKPTGEPSLRVWPVPSRVELAEKDRLEAARDVAQRTFHKYLGHLPRRSRSEYWSRIEVPYDPYFAFEEVLAGFAERRRSKLSVLDSLVGLTQYLTDGKITEMAPITESDRQKILATFARETEATAPASTGKDSYFYLSYVSEDRPVAEQLGEFLNERLKNGAVTWNTQLLLPGDPVRNVLQDTLPDAVAVLALVTPAWLQRAEHSFSAQEVASAPGLNLRVVPILLNASYTDLATLPSSLQFLVTIQGVPVDANPAEWEQSTRTFVDTLDKLAEMSNFSRHLEVDPDDPQKGRWGGRASRNGRTLEANIKEVSSDWFEVALKVSRQSGPPLDGEVEFHLHPTFVPSVRGITVKKDEASIVLAAWGAFTVGALADDGKTRLELDLAKLQGAPRIFRQR